MKISYYFTSVSLLISCCSLAQELPEYNNSATAWNSKTNQSVSLSPEEGLRKNKTAGAMIGKVKVVMQFQGLKSRARISGEDTLKIFAKVDKDTNPQGLFKIYKASITNGNREVLVVKSSIGRGVERSDGDYIYTIKQISSGIVRVNIPNVKSGDELLFYIGTHESSLAKLTLGID
jgi:hypothetical protein